MKKYYKPYFDEILYKEAYGDYELVLEDFEEFLTTLSIPNKVRIACFKQFLNKKDLCKIVSETTEAYLTNMLNRDKLDFKLEKKNGLNHYQTNQKGLNNLFVTVAKFITTSRYIQSQTQGETQDLYDTKSLIKKFFAFFSESYEQEIRKVLNDDLVFLGVDLAELLQYDYILGEHLENYPEEMLQLMEETLKQFLSTGDTPIKIRLYNIPESFNKQIGHHRSKDVGKLFQFEGIIKRKTDVNPILTHTDYLCTNPSCTYAEEKIKLPQIDEKERVLKACPKCKSGVEKVNQHLLDNMNLILEEDYSNSDTEVEKLKSINLTLKGDLTLPMFETRFKPGQKVKVIGVLKEKNITTKGGAASVNFITFLEVNNIICEDNSVNFDISKEEEQQILELSKNPKVFDLLLNNFIPEVKGYPNVKSAMLCQLTGANNCVSSQRPDSHILLVGDPGQAKTVMARAFLDYAPKAMYSSGTNTSKAGLTGACVKDEFTGDWAVEAGVLPKANGGIAVIDEMDKMGDEDTKVMHDALETQIIPIRKAISVDLVCKCGVLGVANPKYSSFDPSQDIMKQIELPGSLLNRFDLIYILRDEYNTKKDAEIADHILKTWNGDELNFNEPEEKLEKEFIRKYIYYARNNINPKISQEAIDVLKKVNNNLRIRTQESLFKFNPRQFNGIVRIAIAHAKLTFKKFVDAKSANFAVNLYVDFLEKIGMENLNSMVASEFDLTHKRIIDYLREHQELNINQLYEKFNNLTKEEIDKEIAKLKNDGLIMEPRKELLKVLE